MRRDAIKVGIIGATGAVGRMMLECLGESGLPVSEIRAFGRERSAGRSIEARGPWGTSVRLETLDPSRMEGLDLVLLSAGAAVSRDWVPRLASAGIWAIDNSSAFRMDPTVPLIVPEINADAIPARAGAIANPNCSTIQMVVVLSPIDRAFGLKRVHVATYQSVSGRGQKGIDALRAERRGEDPVPGAFPHPIDGNVIPQCDELFDDGWTREEIKMIEETRKILSRPDLPVHPTCARVPVEVGHSEALHLELERPVTRAEVLECLAAAPGVRVEDDPRREAYPTPLISAGRNEVWVGRVRSDRYDPRVTQLWVVADNLRKGAAWNAVQIAVAVRAREGTHARL